MSDDLCELFGLPSGSSESMIGGIKFINEYIREHKLNNPECRNEFIPDEKLQKFFGNEPVKYFNMISFLKKHYSEFE